MKGKKQTVEKWDSVQGWLAPGLDGKHRARHLDLLRQFAKKRGLSFEGDGWITAAIEAAALEHPELSEHEGPGRPAYGYLEHKRILEAVEEIEKNWKAEGREVTAAAVARELARIDYVKKNNREPQVDALKAPGKSMEIRVRNARRFTEEYWQALHREIRGN